MSTGFSAGSQALGYLYQARYALFLALSNPEEYNLSIEGLDDITFEEDGAPRELLQLKHHQSPGNLTDSSSDLWKTLRIWSTYLKEGQVMLPGASLTIITTNEAPTGSIAAMLRPGDGRNPKSALDALLKVSEESDNKKLQSSFAAFKELTTKEREILVDSIQILDCSPNIVDTEPKIKSLLKGVRREHRSSVYERLEGWWFKKVVLHLSENSEELISGFEIHDKLCEINDQFKPEALPIDYLDYQPTELPDPNSDNRQFVAQLRAIAIQNKRIEKAILDYYRAFEQRSRWVREDLIVSNDLEVYEKKLVDEWERYYLMLEDEMEETGDEEARHRSMGRKLYNWMEQEADYRIRQLVSEEFIMRGSYHMLADKTPPSIHWHPKFVERLSQILPIS
ncbi:ABC-three component system protein [Leptolyngbya sp. GGD]|uniref:ABC-three component system protein n=1 Tax=Leptolyngbya sp. GGD TaxID=2997907 RepID=UPI00227B9148|nr:ABC-three component system protein [Leptolyngbya sp. GGD]MCY6494603.1 hypothetical protein [Leptolyngbya sp. GGD]